MPQYPGCFLLITVKSQHKDAINFLGCASLEPFFLTPETMWKDLPRVPKIVFVQDPYYEMTSDQLVHYRKEAKACMSATTMPLYNGEDHPKSAQSLSTTLDDTIGKLNLSCSIQSFAYHFDFIATLFK